MNELPSFDHIKDPEVLALLAMMKSFIESQQEMIETLKTRIEQLNRMVHGTSSERMPPVEGELKKRKKKETEEQKEARKKRRKERLAANKAKKHEIEKEEVRHEIAQEDLKCEHCGDTEFVKLGEGEVSREYEFIPARIIQRKHIREKKMCKCKQTIVTAEAPVRVGEKSQHGPELHAHVVVSKCQDSIPLHRMSGQFTRNKTPLSKSTLCEALSTAPRAQEALEFILALYEVEYKMAEEGCLGSERHELFRKVESQDQLNKFHEWLLERRKDSPPKSALGQAVSYTLNQWETLILFVKDVRLALDNNAAERALRPIALGRKNFLFVGNDEAGQNLAMLQSLVGTCMANKVNPHDYIADVLIRIQTHPKSRIDELLPMNWKPQTKQSPQTT